jgi:integrase
MAGLRGGSDAEATPVVEVLGHSTIALTMNVYSHVIPELQREAADKDGGGV